MEPKNSQNAKSVDALKKCENDPYIMLGVAKLFWHNNKVAKARKWLQRAKAINPKLGKKSILYIIKIYRKKVGKVVKKL